jgi:hypothetical protein
LCKHIEHRSGVVVCQQQQAGRHAWVPVHVSAVHSAAARMASALLRTHSYRQLQRCETTRGIQHKRYTTQTPHPAVAGLNTLPLFSCAGNCAAACSAGAK